MSIKIVAAVFCLLSFALSICVNPSQPIGKCTECGPLDVLINGICFVKIRGCLRHDAGPVCLQCQFGYILNSTNCIREAIFLNRTNLKQIPPVKLDTQSILSLAEIKNRLGQLYGNYFNQAHDYFINKYTNQLGKGLIQNVQKLETKKGVFLVIQYLADSQKQYRAVAFVDFAKIVKQWSFQLSTFFKKDPLFADINIRSALVTKLNNYFIYNFKQNGDIYTIDYMNSLLDNIRVVVNKNDLNSPNLFSKLTVNNFGLNNLALQQIVKLYPEYNGINITSSKKSDKYYILNLGQNVQISFSFDSYSFLINKPYFIQSPIRLDVTGIPGGWSTFTNYTDTRFSNAIQFIAKQFPQIIGAQVTKVASQVVAGMNYIISLKKTTNSTTDLYQFRIYLSLSSTYQITSGQKNGQTIYSQNYNYNEDQTFFKVYTIASTNSNVSNLNPIDSVIYKYTGNRKYYKVIYSPTQYMQFEYLTDTNTTNLLTYIIDGENILNTLSTAKTAAQTRSSQVLLNFLKSTNTSLNLARIQQIQVNNTIYTVTVVNYDGTYTAVIEDAGILNLKSLTKISNTTCYDMSQDQIQNSQIIKTIDTFLRSNYPLTGFNIQLIQVNINTTSIIYRFLYATSKLKQIQIYMLQTDNNANIIKAAYINNAFEVVDPLTINIDYQKILDLLKNSTLTGNKVPFFTQANSTIVNSYYDDGKSTYQILYDKINDKSTFSVVNTRSYYLVPDGFSLLTLLVPGTPSDVQASNLAKITQQAIKRYSMILTGSTLAFADKPTSNYTLMFKNSFGYQKFDASIDDKGVVTLGRLIVTGYKDGDFSNCQKFGPTGKCLSCDANTEIEYQGSCWKKLDGCLVQPGNICVRCNANYAKSGQKCFEQCSNFFS